MTRNFVYDSSNLQYIIVYFNMKKYKNKNKNKNKNNPEALKKKK